MRYYPGYANGDASSRSARMNGCFEQPAEGHRYTEKVYSTKSGEAKLVREKVWEYQFGKKKDGTKRKQGKYVLVKIIEH